jgi:tRNA(Arg) A34 adenosine deaminase TadA
MPDGEEFMSMALEEARAALAEGNRPFGCVIVNEGKAVGSGHVRWQSQKDPTAHAEIEAIRAACRALDRETLPDATLYTTGEPCMMCVGAILFAAIPRVIAATTWEDRSESFTTAHAGSLLRAPGIGDYPFQYDTGLLREESLKLASEYEARQKH